MQIELKGMQELIDGLRNVARETSGPGMDKALRAGGRVIKTAMQERAPVRIDPKTPGSNSLEPGALRAGIRSFMPKSATPREVIVGPSSRVAHVARWIEYGFVRVHGGQSKVGADGKRRGKGTVTGFQPAAPFLRPAFESSVQAAEAALVDSLKKSIAEQVG